MSTDQSVPAYYLTKAQVFFYAGDWYTALGDPSGEFSTTIKVRRHTDNHETELYIRDGDRVIIRDEAS